MLKNKNLIVLFAIFFLGSFIRFFLLSKYPISIYWDEASIGYNAYSILHTGRDEYGVFLPIIFRAFNDYKLGGYIYLTSLAEFLFGLNYFAVRFFSAFLGSLTVILTFFITKKLLDTSSSFKKISLLASFLAAFFLSISPWHINFSRAGFEANAALFFVALGFLLLLKSVFGNKKKLLFLSSFIFALSFYFYRSEFVFVPLLLLISIILFWDFVKKNLKLSVIAILIFVITLLPLLFSLKSEFKTDRGVKVSVVNNAFDTQVMFARDRLQFNNIIGKIVFNNKTAIAYKTLQNYLQNFNLQFLFFTGDPNGRQSTKGMGMLYLIDAPFLIFGLYKILRSKGKAKFLILGWFLIGFIPAAISDINPHALRGLNNVIAFEIIIAIGVASFISLFDSKIALKKTVLTAVLICYLLFFVHFIYLYFFYTPKVTAKDWGDGYRELYSYVSTQTQYKKIIISGHYWEPYIYFLFYSKYDPSLYQKSGSVFGFGKYIFGGTSWDLTNPNHTELDHLNLEKLAKTNNFLVAMSYDEYKFQKKRLIVVKNIYNISGKLMFIVARPK